MKQLPDQKNSSRELIPVIFQVAGQDYFKK